MKIKSDKTLSRIYLLMEIDNSIYLVEVALATLQKYGESRGGNFLFMLLMSTGLERLMKIIMNLSEYKESNRFLSSSELKNYGHDLIELRIPRWNSISCNSRAITKCSMGPCYFKELNLFRSTCLHF
jgi:hypothetical protein